MTLTTKRHNLKRIIIKLILNRLYHQKLATRNGFRLFDTFQQSVACNLKSHKNEEEEQGEAAQKKGGTMRRKRRES
jgi:hypothetical protein